MMNKDKNNDKIRKIVKKGLTLSLCAVLAGGVAAGSFEGFSALTGETTVQAADKNDAKLTYAKSEKKADKDDAKEDDSKKKDSKDAAGQDLVITMKDGTEHTFRNVTPDDWKEPVFYNEYEILYISYTDEKGKSQEALEDAKEMICLEVSKYSNERSEALESLLMAESNLESAEENLRTAMIGFEEGVVDANTAMAAQTAWLKAHSEYIESGIALQIASVNLQKAQGDIK